MGKLLKIIPEDLGLIDLERGEAVLYKNVKWHTIIYKSSLVSGYWTENIGDILEISSGTLTDQEAMKKCKNYATSDFEEPEPA